MNFHPIDRPEKGRRFRDHRIVRFANLDSFEWIRLVRISVIFSLVYFICFCSFCNKKSPTPKEMDSNMQKSASAKMENTEDENYVPLGESGYEAQLMSEFTWNSAKKNGWKVYTTPENNFYRYAITVVTDENAAEEMFTQAPEILSFKMPHVDNWQPNLANTSAGTMGIDVKLPFKQITMTGCQFENDIEGTVYFMAIERTESSQWIVIVITKRSSANLDPRGPISASIRQSK